MKASAGTRGYWEDQNQRIDSFTIITVRANAFLFMSECRWWSRPTVMSCG